MKILSITLLSILSVSSAAFAAETLPPVVSGGVGETSEQSIEAVEENYNTKLVFTGKGGFYLANVDVVIRDKAGVEVVNGTTNGPFLLTELKPGRYTVEATAEGFHQKRAIKVVGESLKTHGFEFPIVDDARMEQNDSSTNHTTTSE